MVRVVLGVDGGNTKSVAVVVDEDGAVLGRGQSGCSDIYGAASLEEAMVEAWKQEVGTAIEVSRK